MHEAFYQEFGSNSSHIKNLNARYKLLQKDVFKIMDLTDNNTNDFDDIDKILAERSANNKFVINSIIKDDASPELLFSLLPDYIHMSLNRAFLTRQRTYEFLIYHFLERYYKSLIIVNSIKT